LLWCVQKEQRWKQDDTNPHVLLGQYIHRDMPPQQMCAGATE